MELDSTDIDGDDGEFDNLMMVISSFDMLFFMITSGWSLLSPGQREEIAIILGRQAVRLRGVWLKKGIPLKIVEAQLATLADMCDQLRSSEPINPNW